MKLYIMELYKICHKKIFITGAVCIAGIILFAFWTGVKNEAAVVGNTIYTGYQAVQINKQITEEFKGALTDEKAEKIIEKYGFPLMKEKNGELFWSSNFLNQFVMDYLSDGYFYNENEFGTATCIWQIEDSDLGTVTEMTGEEVILEYYAGWRAFLNILPIGMILGSILVLFGVSDIFANEGQTKMLPLLFTTKEGKEGDIYAKITAAFTVAAIIWSGVFLLDILLCGIVYGLDGLHCYNGMVLNYLFPRPDRMIPMHLYITMAILLSLFGILSLCAITICISACFKSSFHAVVNAAIWWGVPFLITMFSNGFQGIFKFMSAAPVFMVVYLVIDKTYDIWPAQVVIAGIVMLFCTMKAYRNYKRQQAG